MQRITSSDSQFHDGDPSTGVLGTFLAAAWHNAVQEEIAGFIEGAGIVLDPTSNAQLAKAFTARNIGAAPLADTGAVNAYAATNIVPLVAGTLVHGVRQRVTIGTTNSGASTYAPDGLPAKPVLGLNLKPLQGAELLATQVAELEYVVAASVNGGSGAWLLLRCAGGAQQLGAATYGVAPPQFDNSAKLPTTAFVQQSLGSFSGYAGISASRALATSDIGKALFIASSALIVTLPTPASLGIPLGAAATFFTSGSTGATFVPGGGAIINAPGANAVASFPVGYGQCATLVAVTGTTWQVVHSTAALGQSTDFASALATSGYQKLPSGLIIQWGTYNTSGTAANATVTLPISFPNTCLSVSPAAYNSALTLGCVDVCTGKNQSSFTVIGIQIQASSSNYSAHGGNYIAIGY